MQVPRLCEGVTIAVADLLLFAITGWYLQPLAGFHQSTVVLSKAASSAM